MDDFDNAFNSLGTLMVGPVARTVVVVVVVLVVRVVVVVVGGGGHFRGFGFFGGFWGVLDGSEGEKDRRQFLAVWNFWRCFGGFTWLQGPKKTW